MFKTKRVLGKTWAELSPAHRNENWRWKARRGRWRRRRRRATPGRRVKGRRGKNPRQGESLEPRQRQRTEQTEQSRTIKIHKRRQEAIGFSLPDLVEKRCQAQESGSTSTLPEETWQSSFVVLDLGRVPVWLGMLFRYVKIGSNVWWIYFWPMLRWCRVCFWGSGEVPPLAMQCKTLLASWHALHKR